MFLFKFFKLGKTLLDVFYRNRIAEVTPVGKKCATSAALLWVTSATLPEVTSAISHSDRGSDSRREEMCHFGGTSRSNFGDTSRSDFGDTSRSNAEVTSRSVAEVEHFFPTGVTSAIRMRYRGRSFSSAWSHLIVPSAIENACIENTCLWLWLQL